MIKFSTNSKTDIVVHISMMISALLIFFFAFFFLYLPWSTNHGESVSVPNIEGLSFEQAKDKLDAENLDYEISDSVFIAGVKPLSIVSNYPKSGANVKTGRKIYLTLAAESAPLVKVPNIIGRSTSSARNQLLSAGLISGEDELIPALEENTVLKAKLDGRELTVGEEIPKGSKITLVVGDGYGNLKIEVPDLTDMDKEEADILLSGLGLSLGSVISEPTTEADPGKIFRQQPAIGSKISNGAPVNIWISGSIQTATPKEEN